MKMTRHSPFQVFFDADVTQCQVRDCDCPAKDIASKYDRSGVGSICIAICRKWGDAYGDCGEGSYRILVRYDL